MLCTQLLSEAEILSDVIATMLKCCMYTYGTRQYLSQKFGMELTIYIRMDDDSEESYTKCDNFLGRSLLYTQMTISRPKTRIYVVPASEIALPDLFAMVEEAKRGDNGFCYYTCSSSSSERVSMEIVRLSESPDDKTAFPRNLQLVLSDRPPPSSQFDRDG
jgi:hypothetical protein